MREYCKRWKAGQSLGTRLPDGYDGGEREVTHLSGCVVARMLLLEVGILLPVAIAVRI